MIEDNLIPLIMTKISMILHNCSSLFSLYICFHVCNCTDTMHLLSINEYLLEAFPLQIGWMIFFFFFVNIGLKSLPSLFFSLDLGFLF